MFKYIASHLYAKETGFEPIKSGQIKSTRFNNETIIDYLVQSELVIADITRTQSERFYRDRCKLTGKPIIHLMQK